MYRGTTPTLTFKANFDLDTIINLTIVFKQGGEIKLKKYLEDCEVDIENKNISVTLSETATIEFIPNKDLHIQIRIRFEDGTVISSKVMTSYIDDILEEEFTFAFRLPWLSFCFIIEQLFFMNNFNIFA